MVWSGEPILGKVNPEQGGGEERERENPVSFNLLGFPILFPSSHVNECSQHHPQAQPGSEQSAGAVGSAGELVTAPLADGNLRCRGNYSMKIQAWRFSEVEHHSLIHRVCFENPVFDSVYDRYITAFVILRK